ncbi:DNA polymerase III subunit gamma/tau [Thermodesulfobacteriota bacterium]
MSYLVLARKYRPQTFDEVVEQGHVIQTLTNAISVGRVAHAVLFSGPRGTGKTTVARLLAKAMNCKEGPTSSPCNLCRSCREITSGNAVDVFEIDGASNNSVDQIRDLRENLKYMPAHSAFKIYIIDEVHMLSIAAFNALLKSLEEPPAHVMFIFATTEPHKIPITILSRCQRHDFRRIPVESISRHMESVCDREKFKITAESLWLIAREAGGSMRDALSLLDQVMACTKEEITDSQVLEVLGVIDRKVVFDMSKAVLDQDIPQLLNILHEVYQRGHDIKKVYGELLEHFRNMMIVKMGQRIDQLVDLPAHEIDQINDHVREIPEDFLKQLFDFLFSEDATVRLAVQPKLALELAFVKMMQLKPVLPIDVLIEKLDMLRQDMSERMPVQNDRGSVTFSSAKKKNELNGGHQRGVADPKKLYQPGEALSDADPDKTWQNIFEMLSNSHPSLATYLTNCVLKKISDRRMELVINGNGFNINMVNRPKNKEALKQAFNDYFGKKIDLTIKGKVVPDDQNREKKQRENQLKQEALSHPLVGEALEIFNGKIVDVKILKEAGE